VERPNTFDLEQALRSNRAISRLFEEDRGALVDHMAPRFLDAGDLLFRQGDEGHELYVLVDGLLRVECTDESGHNTRLRDVHRGEFVGEMSVLDPAPRSATLTAETDCELWCLRALDLAALQRVCPAAAVALVDGLTFNMTQRLRRLDGELEALSQEHVAATPPQEALEAARSPRKGVAGLWSKLFGSAPREKR